ncbi:hypothetical protein PN836_020670 [Ningiella sp. W23]|uniref:hypothetical protein n=1 Tax=Ningiella sp. W23 TaxID=3023715 RepID=UPI0037569172
MIADTSLSREVLALLRIAQAWMGTYTGLLQVSFLTHSIVKGRLVMTSKKTEKQLKSTYQAMLDALEEFVEKEGKTLKDAFHGAEKKLEEAAEHSKESIQHASDSLKAHSDAEHEHEKTMRKAYAVVLYFSGTNAKWVWHLSDV